MSKAEEMASSYYHGMMEGILMVLPKKNWKHKVISKIHDCYLTRKKYDAVIKVLESPTEAKED